MSGSLFTLLQFTESHTGGDHRQMQNEWKCMELNVAGSFFRMAKIGQKVNVVITHLKI